MANDIHQEVVSTQIVTEADGNVPLLKRREAAEQLGVSESTFRRRFEGSQLTPIVGEDKIHRFRAAEVRELTVRRVQLGRPDPAAFDGEIAAEVFALFNEGFSATEVVTKTKRDPRLVSALRNQYAELQGGLFLSASEVAEIELLPWITGEFPIKSSEVLLSNLRDSGPARCSQCGHHQPTLCVHCAKKLTWERARAMSIGATEAALREGEHRARGRAARERLRSSAVSPKATEGSASPPQAARMSATGRRPPRG